MISKNDLENDLKQAIKARDTIRKNTIRIVLTAVKLAEVEKRAALDEGALQGILQKQAKMRRESIEEAISAERMDLVPALEKELSILEGYLPEQLSEDAIRSLILEAIQESGGDDPPDMGTVMRLVMPRVGGRADGKVVSGIVRKLLTKA
jgi:uncharacterized protein YqeY